MRLGKAVLLFVLLLAVVAQGCNDDGAGVTAEGTSSAAKKAWEKGDLQKVEDILRAKDPTTRTPEDNLMLYDALRAKGERDNASEPFYQAMLVLREWEPTELEKVPDLVARIRTYFDMVCRMDDFEFGKSSFTKAGFYFPDSFWLACMYASEVFRKMNPSDPEFWVMQGKCLTLSGKYGHAYTAFDNYLRDITGEPDPWVLKWRADCHRETCEWQGEWRDGKFYPNHPVRESFYQRTFRIYDDLTFKYPNEPSFWQAFGVAYLRYPDKDAALRCFNKALELDPKYASTHYELALLLKETDRTEQALEHLNTAIESEPDFPEPYMHRGYIYFIKLGRNLDAIKDLEHLVKITGGHAESWSLLGDCYSNLALTTLRLGIFYDKYDPTKMNGWDKAEGYLKRGAEAFTHALEHDPSSHNSHYRLGDIWGMWAKWDECYTELRKAIEFGKREDPQYYLYWYTLGKYYQWSGKHTEALDYFEITWGHFAYLCKFEAKRDGRIKTMNDPVELDSVQAEVFACIQGSWGFSVRCGADKVRAGDISALREQLEYSGNTREDRKVILK